ncbi:MAG: hypothetical protein Kapaf2KO_08940 [Candidatus Kapaibacteriales bacterium]
MNIHTNKYTPEDDRLGTKGSKPLYTLLLVSGTILLIISASLYFYNSKDLIDGNLTNGRVIKYVKFDEAGNIDLTKNIDPSEYRRFPVVEFTDQQGQNHTFIEKDFSIMSLQQKDYEVIYNPDNPEDAMIYSKIDLYALPLISMMTGIGSLAFGLVSFNINRKRQAEALN